VSLLIKTQSELTALQASLAILLPAPPTPITRIGFSMAKLSSRTLPLYRIAQILVKSFGGLHKNNYFELMGSIII
jgi:hypothetical protein